ncbi:hypothetical protein CK501_16450 [Halovibrio salipaludis]|uniref:DUF6160 domain-containing protein n=1 Tax=Halovibrio salipaludis TaxID=2032626 RepID=A0A2A2EU56_9GAMM|nr:DUF6160 family protein [Halovibrio salipaludis]PAU75823.1 hypothetical protein CK501_16450 [Halovibrio salipaludis]
MMKPVLHRWFSAAGMALYAATGQVGAMEAMDDAELAGVQGQAGVTVEMAHKASMDRFSYFTNDNGIHLEDIQVGSASDPDGRGRRDYELDLLSDGSLEIGLDIQDERVSVGGISLDDSGARSMGSFWMDRDMNGWFRITPGGALSEEGYTFNSFFSMLDSRFGYQTNGHQLFLDDVTMFVNASDHTLDVENGVIQYVAPTDLYLDIAAIRYAEGETPVRGDQSSRPSMGGFEIDQDFVSEFEISGGGGRQGPEGIRVNADTTLNSGDFLYKTNGYGVELSGMSGSSAVQDLRIEVGEDFTAEARQGLAFTLNGDGSSAQGSLSIDDIRLGVDAGSRDGGRSIGSVNLSWLYENQTINGDAFGNQVYLMAGGHPDAGDEGMRFASEWSLADAGLTWTTNGNSVLFDGIQSWGRGDVTVNVTGNEELEGTQFYKGLRVGFDGISGGYRMDGIRVGSEGSAEGAEVQAGAELLSALGVFRSFEFGNMDGQYTLTPGGPNGDGITINSDLYIEDGRIGSLTEESGQGVWADDLSYEGHIRDMTLEVVQDGLRVVQGEAWSTMDVGNLRVGGAEDGASFGRIVWQRYGQDSEMVITGPEGQEGLKLALTSIFSEAVGDKRNRFLWETGRTTDAEGNPQNGTGMQLVLDNIHTSDGLGAGNNDFGVQTELTVDVREADSADGMQPSFHVNTHTRFRELNVGRVNLVHNDGSGNSSTATALQGVSIQNMDMESNLNATPIP